MTQILNEYHKIHFLIIFIHIQTYFLGIDDYKNDGIHQVMVFVKDNGRDPEPKESQIIVDIKISDVADEPPMFGRGIYQNVLKICSDPQLLQQEEIIVADPDENGEIISIIVSDGTTDLTESFVPSKIDEKTWHLTYAGQLKSFTGALEKLVLTATDGHGESTINEFNVQICSCSADGKELNFYTERISSKILRF